VHHDDSSISHDCDGRRTVKGPASVTITPIFVADLLVEGERWPVCVHRIDHPDARVLVDTGMTELRPEVADMDPRLTPLSEQAGFDLAGIDIVVNTHLHFDHCGGNHLFAGKPFYVQRQELEDARGEDYTIPEWVDAPGVQYVQVDGEHELLSGVTLMPALGHTRGMQVVVVETGGRRVVVGGDVAVRFAELDEPSSEGQLRVRALDPEQVWLAHERQPWRPPTV
jgi:N-acyl homoserine lactone hydrolase